jgi:hypothetical protein
VALPSGSIAQMIDARDVLDRILAVPVIGAPVIVAVDGPAGSGKSTLARELAELSGAALVGVDDFVTWHDFGAWWPRLRDDALLPLASGMDATYQVRDWEGDEFGSSVRDWKTVPWAPLVIIEGVTSARREAVPYLSFAIWVEAAAALRLARGLARDGEDHRTFWTGWMHAEQEFFDADGTRERADVIIDTS